MDTSPFVCQKCGSIVAPDDLFCSHCGAPISNKSKTLGIGRQIWIYGVSLLLPPFGLIWTVKYILHGTKQQKTVGFIAAGLTVLSILVTLWVVNGFLQNLQNQLNSVSNFSNMPY